MSRILLLSRCRAGAANGQIKMKGKIFMLLFASPFFGVGVWMAFSIAGNLTDAWQMDHWQPVQATLQSAGYESHSGDGSSTYEAYAEYHYEFVGQRYIGHRVSIAGGADNIGDYQTDLGNRLSQQQRNGESITIYVDPDEPTNAVIDRSLRWGLIGFKSIFLFVFGGVGLGLIIFTLRAPKEKDLDGVQYVNAPWLSNDDWKTAEITSSSKATMYFTWIFAAIWNLISAPLPFLIVKEVTRNDNMLALVGLLFPVVGAGLLVWAVRRTLEWNRFGAAPVKLDPFPGSIGGHVGGTIDINLPFDSSYQFSLTLVNLRSYMSGSGDDRSRRESAVWQDTQVAHNVSGARGSRLSFRFDVPDELHESAADQSEDEYYLWRLSVNARLPGVDFDRDYELPVYATGQESRNLSAYSIDRAKTKQRTIDISEIEKLFQFTNDANGKRMLFPAGRNAMAGLSGLLFGAIFSGIGWFLVTEESHFFMGGIFGFVGVIIAISALYFVLNSLEITRYAGELRTTRRILGLPVKRRQMRVTDFVRFSKRTTSKTQSGTKHIVQYSVSAVDSHNHRLVVGEGFKGASQAETAAEFIGQKFGLIERADESLDARSVDNDYDVLAAD